MLGRVIAEAAQAATQNCRFKASTDARQDNPCRPVELKTAHAKRGNTNLTAVLRPRHRGTGTKLTELCGDGTKSRAQVCGLPGRLNKGHAAT